MQLMNIKMNCGLPGYSVNGGKIQKEQHVLFKLWIINGDENNMITEPVYTCLTVLDMHIDVQHGVTEHKKKRLPITCLPKYSRVKKKDLTNNTTKINFSHETNDINKNADIYWREKCCTFWLE